MKEGRAFGLPQLSLVRDAPRWTLAGVVAIALHAAVGLTAAAFAPERQESAPNEEMIVELAPMIISEPEPVEEVETVEALEPEKLTEIEQPPPAEEVVEEEVAEAEPEEVIQEEPEQIVAEAPPEEVVREEPEPVVEEEPEEVVEEKPVPEVKTATVVLPKKQPPRKPKVEPRKEPKKVERPRPVKKVEAPKKEAPKRVTRRNANPEARASNTRNNRPRQAQASAPRVDPGAWHGRVRSAIFSRKPGGIGQPGRVGLQIVVNTGSGAITSARVSRSSGNSRLDQLALSMTRGRVPAAPAGIGRATYSFSFTVTFER